jgi:hypothetical protein
MTTPRRFIQTTLVVASGMAVAHAVQVEGAAVAVATTLSIWVACPPT